MSATDETPVIESGRSAARRAVLIWLALAVLALAVGYAWFFGRQPEAPVAPPPPTAWRGPVPVRVVPVAQEDFTVYVQAIGTVTPRNAVTVRSRVAGMLVRVPVREGQQLRRGELLAEIDPAPYKVALAQAEGQQQQNLAQLRNAERELVRYRKLFDEDALARQQLERQEALVQQLRGTLRADQAQIDHAKLQLSYTRITAPIDGRVGLRRVDAGNLVGANDAEGLFSILQTRPISVSFSVPEAQVPRVRAAHAGKQPPLVEALDREGRMLLATGRLDTLDNQIDLATGTLRLKARFENADDALFPNQFVNVRLALETLAGALVVPGEALQHGSAGPYVYVIVDGKAQVRPVRPGPADSRRTVLLEGVGAGEAVVLEGLDRLEAGRAVTIVETEPGAAR